MKPQRIFHVAKTIRVRRLSKLGCQSEGHNVCMGGDCAPGSHGRILALNNRYGGNRMNQKVRILLVASLVALAMTTSVWAQTAPAKTSSTFYTQTNLVSSMKSLKAKVHDKNLLNPWGLVQGPTPFWVSDNNAGVSTLYDGNGKVVTVKVGKKNVPFVVKIPPPGNSNASATPSGLVFNGTSTDFTGDLFIFSAEDGTISGWQLADNADAVRHVDNSAIPTAA